MPINKNQRSKQVTRALLKIRALLLSGEYTPDQNIPLTHAVKRLGFPEDIIGLALTELEYQGLLEIRPDGGFIVRNFSMRDVHDAIELRGLIEGMAARKLAEATLTQDQLKLLRGILKSLDRNFDSRDSFDDKIGAYIQYNAEFHSILIEMTDSPMIERSLKHVVSLPFSSPNDFVFAGTNHEAQLMKLRFAQEQHWAVYQAICDGEGMRAEIIMREHAQVAKKNFNIALSQKFEDCVIPALALVSENK